MMPMSRDRTMVDASGACSRTEPIRAAAKSFVDTYRDLNAGVTMRAFWL
jgi:hypothetical protein